MKRAANLQQDPRKAARWAVAALSAAAVLAVCAPASAASDPAPAQVVQIADHARERYATADRLDPEVSMAPRADTALQEWDVRDAREGGVRVVNVATGGCLLISPIGPVDPPVHQVACRDDTYEVWKLTTWSDGSVSFVNTATGDCLAVDLNSPTFDALLRAETCTGATHQRFHLV